MWNELTELGSSHDLASQEDPDVVRLVVNCTYCGVENVIWARKAGVKKTILKRGDDQ